MKLKILVFSITATIAIQFTFAQNNSVFKNLKIKSVGIHLGAEQDVLMGNTMSARYFNSLTGDPSLNSTLESRIDNAFIKHSGVCENPHFRLSLALQLPKPNRELHIGLIGVFNRLDGLVYQRKYEQIDFDFFNYNLNSNELAIQTDYVFSKKLNLIENVFHVKLYGLGGTNIGYQYANRLVVSGTEEIRPTQLGTRLAIDGPSNFNLSYNIDYECNCDFDNEYEASNAINQRVYLGGGLGLVFFNRLELGVKGRFGYGYRYHFSNEFAATNLRSFDFNIKWLLK